MKLVLASTFEPYLERLSAALPEHEVCIHCEADVTPEAALPAVEALEAEVGPLRPEILGAILIMEHVDHAHLEFISFPRAWAGGVRHSIHCVRRILDRVVPECVTDVQYRITLHHFDYAMDALSLWSPEIAALVHGGGRDMLTLEDAIDAYYASAAGSILPCCPRPPTLFRATWRNGGIRFLLPDGSFAAFEPCAEGMTATACPLEASSPAVEACMEGVTVTVHPARPLEASSVLRARALLTGWTTTHEPLAFSPWEKDVVLKELNRKVMGGLAATGDIRENIEADVIAITRMLPHGSLGLKETAEWYGWVKE